MRNLLATTAMLSVLALPALATDRNNTGPTFNSISPTAVGVSVARSNATAYGVGGNARARGGNAAGGNAAGGSASGGGATVTNNVTAGGTDYGRRVPDASAPAIWSNNPCVVALSGGVAVAGFGASFGAGIEDRDCTRRATAQHLTAMGEGAAAREVLCENSEVRAAFRRVNRPCAADVPAEPVMQSVAASVVAPATPRRNLPAYCNVPGIQNSECVQ